MKKNILNLFIIIIVTFSFANCKKDPVYAGEPKLPCNLQAKPTSFCILEAYGSVNYCAKCHPGQGPFDILDYNAVKARTVPGNPDSSLLYLYLKKGGKMHTFGSAKLEEVTYKWIKEGANP